MKLLDRERSVLLPPTTGGKLVKVTAASELIANDNGELHLLMALRI